MHMGLITWIVMGIVILAIIGMGWQAFFSGIVQGVEKLGQNPIVENITNGAKVAVESIRPN